MLPKEVYQLNDAHKEVGLQFPNISRSDTFLFFEEILAKGLSLRLKVTGKSMIPFLRGGEVLTIESRKNSKAPLRKGDLIFFKAQPVDQTFNYVIHRIVKKSTQNNGDIYFQTKGDGVMALDHAITGDRILGIVTKIARLQSPQLIEMDTYKWKVISYCIATKSLAKSRLYYCGLKLRKQLLSFLRGILNWAHFTRERK